MDNYEFEGINSFLVGMANELLKKGIKRETRNATCYELPYPILITINNPCSRWITINSRKWNPILPYAESLWMASGNNDLKMISHYLERMGNFSDNGLYLHGAYGPRIRDYNNDKKLINSFISYEENTVDQLKYIEDCFQKDSSTRRAVIQIGNPAVDCFSSNSTLLNTLDFPCTRTLHFIKNNQTQKLDLIVHIRSNDFIWGASGVNIFNFTFMQEYIASILNLGIGKYYHFADNFHYYDYHNQKVIQISKEQNIIDDSYQYNMKYNNLKSFYKDLNELYIWEKQIRLNKMKSLKNFENSFFNDWAKIFFYYNCKEKVQFKNPILNKIVYRG